MSRQKELEGMSDDELELIIHNFEHPKGNNYLNFFNELDPSEYCQNPEDIMPLAFENNLSFTPTSSRETWVRRVCRFGSPGASKSPVYDIWIKHKNPLRAACIVLILMKEAVE